MDTIRTI